jgi:hypothetical protein
LNMYYNIMNEDYVNNDNIEKLKVEQDMFMDLQQSILKATCNDNVIRKSCIGCIKSKTGKKFLFYCDNKSVRAYLILMYEMRNDNSIVDFFGKERVLEYEVLILEENVEENYIDDKYIYYERRFGLNKKKMNDINIDTHAKKNFYSPQMFYSRLNKIRR